MDESQNNQPQNSMASAPTPEPTPIATSETQPVQAPVEQPIVEPNTIEPSTTEPTAPKAPKNNKTKKLVILLCSIGGGIIILVVLAIIFLPMLLRVDYSDSYKYAKQLDEKINKLAYNSSCNNVLYYYDSPYASDKVFGGYIEDCKAATEGLGDLANKLGQTAGIKRNKDLQDGYNKFKETFDKLAIDSESLGAKLEIYRIWHSFKVASDNLDELSNDSSFNTAAAILTESNIETFKDYGAKWLEYSLAYAKAYRTYFEASYSDKDWNEKREDRYNKEEELDNFVKSNEPDVETLAPINMENINAVATRFDDLFKAIAETYAKNYNKGSGDCDELFGEVHCSY